MAFVSESYGFPNGVPREESYGLSKRVLQPSERSPSAFLREPYGFPKGVLGEESYGFPIGILRPSYVLRPS